MIEVKPRGLTPCPVWWVIYEESVRIATIEKFGPRSFVVASYPHRNFWTCQTSLEIATRWCIDNAEGAMDGGVLDDEDATELALDTRPPPLGRTVDCSRCRRPFILSFPQGRPYFCNAH